MIADNHHATSAGEAPDPMHATELLVSRILRTGVVASLTLIVLGMVLTFVHHPEYLRSTEAMTRLSDAAQAQPRSLREIAVGAAAFRGRAITTVGLLLLIATPIARVAVLMIAYFRRGDRLFAALAAIVLALLLVSFFLGKGE